MEIIKDQHIDELLEQYVQVIEYANQYYEVSLFEPLKMWSMLHKSISLRFPDIFHFVELCLCAPFSNATVKRFFNYLKIVKTDWRSRLNERNIESLLRIKVEGPDLKEMQRKCVLTQSHCGGSEKNDVLLKENVKIAKTVKQNQSEKDSLTLILMNSWVI